uniref:Uncharacterized protein n=1 Tax=Cacopsylla melanoneura TaxID=428564 RepID=A0A8D8SX20_9HEMI
MYKCAVIGVLIVVLLHQSILANGKIVYEGNSQIMEGDPINISCTLTIFEPIKWQLNGHNINESGAKTTLSGGATVPSSNLTPAHFNYTVNEAVLENGYVQSVLSIERSDKFVHTGLYRCNTLYNDGFFLTVVDGKERKTAGR